MHAFYTSAEVSKILGFSPPALRASLRAAVLPAPKRDQRYSFQDLILLKTCRGLLDAELSITRIRRLLNSLRSQIPEDQHLSTLRIYASGRRIVVWDGTSHWQPDSGQFLFSFDPINFLEPKKHPRRLKQAKSKDSRERTAQDWFALGEQLEEHSPEEARTAYLKAVSLDSSFAPALLNLGRLSYDSRNLTEAERYYRSAMRSAPQDGSAAYNLAVVLAEAGRSQAAIEAYLIAIKRHPTFEAHYHLAALYETQGKTAEALRHYHAARKLQTPGGRSRRIKPKGRGGPPA